jgi:hypothetical protein
MFSQTLSQTAQFAGKKLLQVKRLFWFSLKLFFETFLILRIQHDIIINLHTSSFWYSNLLRAGQSGIESRWEARFSVTVQTGPETHPTSYTMGTGSFPRVALTTHSIPRRG